MLLNLTTLEERQEHNRKMISKTPDEIRNGRLIGDQLIVKCFYYELEASETENGIIEPVYKITSSDGNKIVATLDDYPFQDRGVVVNVGEGTYASKFQVGQIVWINHRYGVNSDLLIERDKPVTKPHGYKLIPASSIELVEPNVYFES